jgi:hypothetical protein
MLLLSCSNCWFNGLQYGSVGLSVGYCTEHRVVLRAADYTTCGRHMRKDLPLKSAEEANCRHGRVYPREKVSLLSRDSLNGDVLAEQDSSLVSTDSVGDAVAQYGGLDAKIESLAQLRSIPGARAELAMLSLARSYVQRCVARRGAWTSGLHLLWWTRRRLAEEPQLQASDIRLSLPVSSQRQVELAKWSIVMLRLAYVSDVGEYAKRTRHRVARLATLVEDAARATQSLNLRRLLSWIKAEAVPKFDRTLPRDEYARLARLLHRG